VCRSQLLESAKWGNADGVKKYVTEQNINAPVINEARGCARLLFAIYF